MERTADLTTIAYEVRAESEGGAVIDRTCPSSSSFVLRASELVRYSSFITVSTLPIDRFYKVAAGLAG